MEGAESETPTFSSDWRLNEWVSHKRWPPMRRPFRTRGMVGGRFPGLHPGLVCVAPLGQGPRGFGSVS